jgi:hypothetical protein
MSCSVKLAVELVERLVPEGWFFCKADLLD